MKLTYNGFSIDLSNETTSFPETFDKELINAIETWNTHNKIDITTSGSTGKPQSISLPESLIRWSAKQTKAALNLNDEQVLLCIPYSKIGGRMLLIRSLIYDWDITIQKPEADPMLSIPDHHNFSLVSIVPYQLANIYENEGSLKKLLRFRTVLIGGGEVPKVVEKQTIIHSHTSTTRFFHSYGMTETASHIALRKMAEGEAESFQLLDGVVASATKNQCLNIHIPEIEYSIVTNDVVELDGNRLVFLHRMDDVVNSGGMKLQLADISKRMDHLLEDANLVCSYFLWKVKDDKLGEKLIFVGIRNNSQPKIIETISTGLSSYEVPKSYYWTSSFLMTESGKLDRIGTVKKLIEVGG